MTTVDVNDVICDNLTKILDACAGKKRHGELAEATKTLLVSLQTGTLVLSSAGADGDLAGEEGRYRREQKEHAGKAIAISSYLPTDKVEEILVPTRLALQSKSPKIMENMLALLQKLIARGAICGDADLLPAKSNEDTGSVGGAISGTTDSKGAAQGVEGAAHQETAASDDTQTVSSDASSPPVRNTGDLARRDQHAREIIELLCSTSDVPDETVELQMIKCLLTAVSSGVFRVKGRALLRVTRACVNAYLGSSSEVNQTTAKASLTQMLTVVFHRLETRSTHARATPIVVADVFASAKGLRKGKSFKANGNDRGDKNTSHPSTAATAALAAMKRGTDDDGSNQMQSVVQGFINKVTSDLSYVGAAVTGEDTSDTVEWLSSERTQQRNEVTEREFDNDEGTPRKKNENGTGIQSESTSDEPDSTQTHRKPSSNDSKRVEETSLESSLEEDAFLVFRALCKLAKKPGDLKNPAVARGKILSLELLRVLLENAGPVFRNSKKFAQAIGEYLCDAVVVCASQDSLPAAHGLALCCFTAVVKNFRKNLKSEIAVFWGTLLLEPLTISYNDKIETGVVPTSSLSNTFQSSYLRKCVLLACVKELVYDVKLLADVFVNYDCELDSSNLFEKSVEGLCFVGRWGNEIPTTDTNGTANPTTAPTAPAQALSAEDVKLSHSLKLEALDTLVVLTDSLREWTDGKEEDDTVDRDVTSSTDQSKPTSPKADSSLDQIFTMKQSKTEYQTAVTLFNAKPKKGIKALQEIKKCGTTPIEIAEFLKTTIDLDKTIIGDYLGERDDLCIEVMHAYVDGMDFSGYSLDEAIRNFLSGFRLPGESQKIDRLMEKFAQRYCLQNPGSYKSPDTAYVLSFSVIMLNTDAHNPGVKNKMTKEGFIRNNRGIDDGADVDPEHLSELYDRIVTNEIRMKDDDPVLLAMKAEINKGKDGGSSIQKTMKDMSNRLGVDLFMSLMTGQQKHVHEVDTSTFMEKVRERAARDTTGSFQTVHDPLCAKPMFEQFRGVLLETFVAVFRQCVDDPKTQTKDVGLAESNASIVQATLAGYVSAARLAAFQNAFTALDEIVEALTELASPKPPLSYKPGNVEALRFLTRFVSENKNCNGGNCLTEENWAKVFSVASRYDFVFSQSAGFDESGLFLGGDNRVNDVPARKLSGGTSFSSPFRGASGISNLSFKASPVLSNMFGGSSMASDDSPFAHLKKGNTLPETVETGATGSPSTPSKDSPPHPFADLDSNEFVLPNFSILKNFGPDDLETIFLCSDSLDGDTVVSFTKALCEISLAELSSKHPRVFSLTKLVQVAHTNMSCRPRFVWSKMWHVMREFFIKAGCHADVAVAMYVVDSLRQLAVKFLNDRGELSSYSFQNEFLKPFVVVMRQSKSSEIREFIVRCVSQMITGHFGNIKSGWRSVFMVFTTAAGDEDLAISKLAFEIVEKVIRDHFDFITEVDPSTFTDCVNCLIAFTNVVDDPSEMGDESNSSKKPSVTKKLYDQTTSASVISLNAIAFLRFCALKLADGAIGNLELKGGDGEDQGESQGESESTEQPTQTPPSQTQKVKGTTSFTDSENHVYYWFPLLAGLSELTFDRRSEIRRSALEVLFDILNFHGKHFSPAFWVRVYDKILLPIFDHVRAGDEQIDSDDKSLDAWLFQTAQHCLDGVVDLTLKFYDTVVNDGCENGGLQVLENFTNLLASLASRPHIELAACGVGALHRLLSGAGTLFDQKAWKVVVKALVSALSNVAPDLTQMESASEASVSNEAWRLALLERFTSKAATTKLLTQAAAETYFRHGHALDFETLKLLVDSMVSVSTRASELSVTTSMGQTQDLEVETQRATLAVLLHLHARGRKKGDDDVHGDDDVDSPNASDAQVTCGVETRDTLVTLVGTILHKFADRSDPGIDDRSDPSDDPNQSEPTAPSYGQLVTDVLRALTRFDDDAFRSALFSKNKETLGYDSLVTLVSSVATPTETRAALSEVFARRVGPLASRALRSEAER
tara:strand:- start:10415 stop:16393 length:5979 start_codon:yes stop_codon:yes gene_type:complete